MRSEDEGERGPDAGVVQNEAPDNHLPLVRFPNSADASIRTCSAAIVQAPSEGRARIAHGRPSAVTFKRDAQPGLFRLWLENDF
jgi:hypothetical protein